MFKQEQIITILKAKKPELERRYFISELGFFGSHAREELHRFKLCQGGCYRSPLCDNRELIISCSIRSSFASPIMKPEKTIRPCGSIKKLVGSPRTLYTFSAQSLLPCNGVKL